MWAKWIWDWGVTRIWWQRRSRKARQIRSSPAPKKRRQSEMAESIKFDRILIVNHMTLFGWNFQIRLNSAFLHRKMKSKFKTCQQHIYTDKLNRKKVRRKNVSSHWTRGSCLLFYNGATAKSKQSRSHTTIFIITYIIFVALSNTHPISQIKQWYLSTHLKNLEKVPPLITYKFLLTLQKPSKITLSSVTTSKPTWNVMPHIFDCGGQ